MAHRAPEPIKYTRNARRQLSPENQDKPVQLPYKTPSRIAGSFVRDSLLQARSRYRSRSRESICVGPICIDGDYPIKNGNASVSIWLMTEWAKFNSWAENEPPSVDKIVILVREWFTR